MKEKKGLCQFKIYSSKKSNQGEFQILILMEKREN